MGITRLLEKIKLICDTHNGKDTFCSPVSPEQLAEWEKKHNAHICPELKEFYLFTNGMNSRIYFSSFRICPLEKLIFQKGGVFGYDYSKDYMEIGNFMGDGSVLCIDRNYNFFAAYEGSNIEELSLENLLKSELERLGEEID